MTSYLLDTGFLYALINRSEQKHEEVVAAASTIRGSIVLPVPAITETAYLLLRDVGPGATADFIESLESTTLKLENPEPSDYARAAEVIRGYADARIDFVDALIVAMAERLSITTILTLDQRHFRVFRPRHCKAFDLLP